MSTSFLIATISLYLIALGLLALTVRWVRKDNALDAEAAKAWTDFEKRIAADRAELRAEKTLRIPRHSR